MKNIISLFVCIFLISCDKYIYSLPKYCITDTITGIVYHDIPVNKIKGNINDFDYFYLQDGTIIHLCSYTIKREDKLSKLVTPKYNGDGRDNGKD